MRPPATPSVDISIERICVSSPRGLKEAQHSAGYGDMDQAFDRGARAFGVRIARVGVAQTRGRCMKGDARSGPERNGFRRRTDPGSAVKCLMGYGVVPFRKTTVWRPAGFC